LRLPVRMIAARTGCPPVRACGLPGGWWAGAAARAGDLACRRAFHRPLLLLDAIRW